MTGMYLDIEAEDLTVEEGSLQHSMDVEKNIETSITNRLGQEVSAILQIPCRITESDRIGTNSSDLLLHNLRRSSWASSAFNTRR